MPDWRDAAAYAPLLDADRSLFAWEWLRRDARYRRCAERATRPVRRAELDAAAFGLIRFEDPRLAIPDARPLWRSDVHPQVLPVERSVGRAPQDEFDLRRLRQIATFVAGERGQHLLLCDGLRAIRLDGPPGAFNAGPVCLRYTVEGLAAAEPRLLTLRRFLALCRSNRFSTSLHPREPRARRWILMLRAWDARAPGAHQRWIAEELLSRSAGDLRWRSREPSVRSQVQRLVRSARAFANSGYRALLH